MEGAAKVIKCLVVFFNFVFFVLGCLLIGIGVWTLVDVGDFVTISDEVPLESGSQVMIAAGVLIALISFMGCCGAWKENRCLLITFFTCLLVILALEIAAAVLGYQHRGELDGKVNEAFVRALREDYGEGDQTGVTAGYDKLQETQKCCGWNGYKDWFTSRYTNGTSEVPESCCKVQKQGCGKPTINPDDIYTEGCKDKLKDILYYVGALGVSVVVIQILGMIFALVLICKIGNEGTYA